MTDKLQKYKAEFAREFAAHRYERNGSGGLYFPKARAHIGGVFKHRVDDGALNVDDNTMVYQGLNDILNVYFNQSAQETAFYIAPFVNNTVPVATLTAATFTANQGEFTNYTQGVRGLWVSNGASTAQTTGNSAAPATFTIGTGGGTVRGAGLLTSQALSSTTGVLVAAALFNAASVLNAGSKLNIEYDITAQDD